MSDEDGIELPSRDKGKQKMEITTTQDEGSSSTGCTAQLEERLRKIEKQLEKHERMLEKRYDEANAKLLEEHKKGLEKQNDRIIGFQTTAFNLTNWYFVSQAVVFSPLAGDSSFMSCRDFWLHFVVSVVPAIFILSALVWIGNKYREAIKYRNESSLDYERLWKKVNETPPRMTRNTDETPIALSFKRKNWDVIFFYACILVFFIFAAVIAFGSIWRLCLRY